MANAPIHRPTHGKTRERGQVLAMTVISFFALCGLAGVAADLGYSFDDRRRAQTAADAAALAGADELRRGASGSVVSSANASATLNGFTDGTNGATVTVNVPPTSG